MALDTYAGLKASIADFLNRQDLTAVIPDFVDLVEAQFNARLRVREMIARSSASLAAEFADVPDDFAAPINIVLSDGTPLDCIAPEDLQAMKVVPAISGDPRFYAIVGGEFQFYPVPSSAVTISLTYYAKIPALSDSATSNWLLAKRPDIYLYGALVQSAPYLVDDPRAETWGALFVAAMNDLQNTSDFSKYGSRLAVRSGRFAY